MTNYERLLLDLSTDGTITPQEALTQAGAMLMQYFAHIAAFGEELALPDSTAGKAPLSTRSLPSQEYELPIEESSAIGASRELSQTCRHHQGGAGNRDEYGRPSVYPELRPEVAG